MKVAINGFGRIGRNILRAALKNGSLGKKFDLVAINDPSGAQVAAQLLEYDSVHGRINAKIKHGDGWISIDGKRITVASEREPENLPWEKLGVNTVLECTGVFRTRESISKHFDAGAKKVLLSAPAKEGGADITVVMGVNDKDYDRNKHNIISNASCTTNSLAPVCKLIHDNFKIKEGFMTTCHAYTNDQRVLDVYHKDPRRARAAAINIIPTSTGAASAIGDVIPDLHGKLDGMALRVPIPCGSITDMSFVVEKKTTVEALNSIFESASKGEMKGIMQYTTDPIVSSDVVGNPHSAIVDGQLTKVKGNLVKVCSWYDNEWGYSSRMVDMVTKVL